MIVLSPLAGVFTSVVFILDRPMITDGFVFIRFSEAGNKVASIFSCWGIFLQAVSVSSLGFEDVVSVREFNILWGDGCNGVLTKVYTAVTGIFVLGKKGVFSKAFWATSLLLGVFSLVSMR